MTARRKKLPPKDPDIARVIHDCVERRRLLYTDHALARLEQRQVTMMEVDDVLELGQRMESEDHFDEEFEAWNYALTGETLSEARSLIVIVAADTDHGLLIVTVYHPDDQE